MQNLMSICMFIQQLFPHAGDMIALRQLFVSAFYYNLQDVHRGHNI